MWKTSCLMAPDQSVGSSLSLVKRYFENFNYSDLYAPANFVWRVASFPVASAIWKSGLQMHFVNYSGNGACHNNSYALFRFRFTSPTVISKNIMKKLIIATSIAPKKFDFYDFWCAVTNHPYEKLLVWWHQISLLAALYR